MAFQGIAPPKSNLGFHRLLSPTAGVRVSPLCLGSMNFGTAWEKMLGKCDKDTAFAMMDYFFERGGNFIDTANNYQNEESEIWIGEWMAARNNRDQMVIATKFTTGFKAEDLPIKANYQGNHSKSLKLTVAASLKKLQTDYIDLLYLHWWDFSTSIPELMQSLHHLIAAGKVLYLGISDTPAWVVSKANEYARNHGLTQFSVYQGCWNAAMRDFERDIIPMCEAEGMAIAPWGALGRGMFRTDEEWKARSGDGRQMGQRSEQTRAITAALDKLAQAKKTKITSVALAYVMHKAPYVFPIIGGRNTEQLGGNIDALSIDMSDEDLDAIDDAAPFDPGFPMSFLFENQSIGSGKHNIRNTTKDVVLVQQYANLDTVEKPRAIPAHKK